VQIAGLNIDTALAIFQALGDGAGPQSIPQHEPGRISRRESAHRRQQAIEVIPGGGIVKGQKAAGGLTLGGVYRLQAGIVLEILRAAAVA
jgi:hypothetical protein